MIQIDPGDRAVAQARRRSSNRIWSTVAGALILAGIAGIFLLGGPQWLWGKLDGQDRFADVYAALQTPPLPTSLQNRAEILPLLERLHKERCDDKAASGLADALANRNEKRAAAVILAGFATECPRFNFLMYKAGDLYYGLSDFGEARKISDRLVSQWPEIAQFHYLAGLVEEGQGSHAEAAVEFHNTIELTPDRHTLNQAVFVTAAKIYAQLGQPCRSAATLQQWVSLDPGQRDNAASQKLVSDYLGQGRCVNYAAGTDSFPRADKNVVIVQVSIGPATGHFIIDTGASLVTVSDDFARKAGLSGEGVALMKTANGTRPARLGTAPVVQVGRVKSSEVTVAILPGGGEALPPTIDGLLGMSFLSRYRLEISPASVTLSSRR